MTEIILALIIVALLTYHYFYQKEVRMEQKDLLRLIKAKSLEEVTQAEYVDKAEPSKEVKTESDLVAVEDASSDMWDKAVLGK